MAFDLRLETELQAITGDDNDRVKAVVTNKDETISCGFVGLTAGVRPNVGFLQGSGLDVEKGILVDAFLHTNILNVYAIGDCAQLRNPPPGRRPIEAVWYTGRMMGETVAATVCGEKTMYDPGIWFNSAKFFDIEYQVYGAVPAQLPPEMDTIYWEHKDGRKSIRITYDKGSGAVRGFNVMGIRYRHKVCEHWIKNKTHINEVVKHLGKANFDPEFYRKHEKELRV